MCFVLIGRGVRGRRARLGGGSGPSAGPAVGVSLVADGLTSPVTLVPVADGSGRRFIVDQAGTIRVLTADGTLLPTPFLDLRSRIVPLMP